MRQEARARDDPRGDAEAKRLRAILEAIKSRDLLGFLGSRNIYPNMDSHQMLCRL